MTSVTRRCLAVGGAFGLALGTVAGCSSAAPEPDATPTAAVSTATAVMTAPNAVPPGAPGAPRGGTEGTVDGADADAVAEAIASTLLRFDTALDLSPQDAARRASKWMTPELADEQDAQVAGGGAWWNDLAAGNGWTSTVTTPDPEPPPDLGEKLAVRRLFVTVQPHTDAHTAPAPAPQKWVVEVMLARPSSSAQWKAERLQAQLTAADAP